MPTIARYPNEKSNAAEVVDLSWSDLASLLTNHRRGPKSGPAWSPVVLDPPVRANKNVRAITAAVFDLDHLTRTRADEILTRLEEAGLSFVVHSSHSHTEQDYCLRIAVELARAIPVKDWAQVWAELTERFGIPADPNTKDPARLYYLPSAPEDSSSVIAAAVPGIPYDPQCSAVAVPSTLQAPVEIPIVRAPASLAPRTPADAPVDTVPVDLSLLRRRLLDINRPESRDLVRRALSAEALAPVGEHDATLQRLAGVLAYALPLDTPTEALIGLCESSLRAMGWQDGWEHLCAEFAKKIERARESRREKEASEAAVREVICRQDRLESALAVPGQLDVGDPSSAYPEALVAKWAEEQGCISLQDFARRWIIHTNEKQFFLFVNGDYIGPYSRDTAKIEAFRAFSRAEGFVDLWYADDSGKKKRRSFDEILFDHSSVPLEVRYSFVAQRSSYTPKTKTFLSAAARVRSDVKPRRDAQIEEWLALLAGPRLEQLLDWLATATRVERPTAALFFVGPRGSGKSLFANALNRLWSTDAAPTFKEATSNFNRRSLSSPLVFADEVTRLGDADTELLRQMITDRFTQVQPKYRDLFTVEGSRRFLLASNNGELFRNVSRLTNDDIDALSERILRIVPTSAASDYLKEINETEVDAAGLRGTELWTKGDRFAAHVLWLAANRDVTSHERLLVPGDVQEMASIIKDADPLRAAVCQIVAAALAEPLYKTGPLANSVLVEGGRVLVATDRIGKLWSEIVQLPWPGVTDLGNKLREMSCGAKERRRVGTEKKQSTYWPLPAVEIVNWAERTGFGDSVGLRALVSRSSQASNAAPAEADSARPKQPAA